MCTFYFLSVNNFLTRNLQPIFNCSILSERILNRTEKVILLVFGVLFIIFGKNLRNPGKCTAITISLVVFSGKRGIRLKIIVETRNFQIILICVHFKRGQICFKRSGD